MCRVGRIIWLLLRGRWDEIGGILLGVVDCVTTL